MVKNHTQVLLFDNDNDWLCAAKQVLEEERFNVCTESSSFDACVQKAAEGMFLAAVVNVQQISNPREALRRFTDKFPAVSIVSIQDEPDPDLDDLLWYPDQLVHRPFGTKRDHAVSTLPAVIRDVLDRRGMVPKDIDIILSDDIAKVLSGTAQTWTGITSERGRGLSLQILTQELKIVISQMFATSAEAEPIARKVSLEPLDEDAGHSGSCMFRLSPTILLDTERNKTAVLKFGPKDEINRESKNYDRFVEWFLTTDQAVRKIAYAEGSYFAGILYSYPRDTCGGYESYADFIRTAPIERCLKVIRDMFSPSNRHWYSVDASPFFDTEEMRFEKYYVDHTLHASRYEMRNKHIEKMKEEITNLERRSKEPVWTYGEERIKFPQLSLAIPNPISWLGRPHIDKLEMTVIHGDLHGHNIVVDERDRFFLLDFYYTGFGNICRDFIELELSVRYDLLCSRQLSDNNRVVSTNSEKVTFEGLRLLARLEKALIRASIFGEDVADPIIRKHQGLSKAFDLVLAIRAYAEHNCKQHRRLYYMGLATSALKALKYFYPVDVKLHRLILSGFYVDLLQDDKINDDRVLADHIA